MITNRQAEQVLEAIKKSTNILLHCHPSPDGDSVGSSLALYHVLLNMGKKATVIKGDSNPPGHLSRLPGFGNILEKNYLEINPSEFDLFIILDSSAPHQITRLAEIVFPESMRTVIIDHHASNLGFAELNVIDSDYPATSQMLYALFKFWNVYLTHEIAANLFMGIYTDTGGFKYRGTTRETFAAAAELVSVAEDFTELLFWLENSNTRGRLILEGLMLNSIETWFSDHVAVASASYDDMHKLGIKHEDMSGSEVASELRSVMGWDIGITLIEEKPRVIKISMRTRDPNLHDVSKLAVEIGGGGHRAAAGAQINGSIPDATAKLKLALAKTYPELVK